MLPGNVTSQLEYQVTAMSLFMTPLAVADIGHVGLLGFFPYT